MITEATWRIASHELGHAILAHMQGLTVLYVSRDPRNAGQTYAYVPEGDRRSLKEIAFARCVLTIGAVRFEPGIVNGKALFCADRDVQKAASLAEAGKFTVAAASAYARDLCDSDEFRRLHAKGVDALMHQPYLDARAFAKIIR
jgi:hypothetical protein